MSVTVRIGALFAIVGGALLAIGRLVNLAGGDDGTALGHTLVLAAHVLLVVALVGLIVRGSGDVLFSLGGLIAAAGTAMVSALVLVDLVIVEGLLDRDEFADSSAGVVAAIGPVVLIIGLALIGVGGLRSDLPTAAGALLIGGAILLLIALIAPIALVIGAVLTGAAFVWLGMDMLTPKAAADPSGA